MPLLDRTGLKPDIFVRSTVEDAARHGHVLMAWADLPAALKNRSRDQRVGAEVPNTLKAAEIRLVQRQLALIAIRFPSFSDGRGFSLAKQLRNNGYTGMLRAVGPLFADQFSYALACGFDEVEPPDEILERQPAAQWLSALTAISRGYQRGYGDSGNILEQRRAARLAAESGRK